MESVLKNHYSRRAAPFGQHGSPSGGAMLAGASDLKFARAGISQLSDSSELGILRDQLRARTIYSIPSFRDKEAPEVFHLQARTCPGQAAGAGGFAGVKKPSCSTAAYSTVVKLARVETPVLSHALRALVKDVAQPLDRLTVAQLVRHALSRLPSAEAPGMLLGLAHTLVPRRNALALMCEGMLRGVIEHAAAHKLEYSLLAHRIHVLMQALVPLPRLGEPVRTLSFRQADSIIALVARLGMELAPPVVGLITHAVVAYCDPSDCKALLMRLAREEVGIQNERDYTITLATMARPLAARFLKGQCARIPGLLLDLTHAVGSRGHRLERGFALGHGIGRAASLSPQQYEVLLKLAQRRRRGEWWQQAPDKLEAARADVREGLWHGLQLAANSNSCLMAVEEDGTLQQRLLEYLCACSLPDEIGAVLRRIDELPVAYREFVRGYVCEIFNLNQNQLEALCRR